MALTKSSIGYPKSSIFNGLYSENFPRLRHSFLNRISVDRRDPCALERPASPTKRDRLLYLQPISYLRRFLQETRLPVARVGCTVQR